MRLLHVIADTDQESGGPIEAVVRFSQLLQRDGHEVQIASLESPEVAAQRTFGIPVIGCGRGFRKYGYNPRLNEWVRQNADRFDAVVAHGLWNYSSVGTWRAMHGHPTPYFIFAHGMLDPWFRENYPLKHAMKQALWTLAEGRALRDARAVFFTCEEERVRAQGAFFGYRYRHRIVPLGTGDPEGDPQAQRAAFLQAFPSIQGRRLLLFLSRIHPKKGCDMLLKAFAAQLPRLPADLDLMMAGPDQIGWVGELQQMAASLGIAERVHWPGMLRGDLKWGAYRSADAFILPSHQENFGFVVPEAMACGAPVLISDKVNIWREVEEADAGLVAPDTEEGTRRLIEDFFALDDEARAAMARAARAGFRKLFDIEAATREFAAAIGFETSRATLSAAETER